ncbi:MAG: MarR family transcriptional regulator, partial [Nitrospira sp.]|nr:MarR family transcriptional regulator [Nitrospira sp.]
KARKGSSWSHVLNIFQACDPVWAHERVKSGLSSGEGLIWNVRDPIYKKEPVKDKGGKHTGEYQETCVDPGIDDKRLLAQEAEFASLLHMPDRSGNTLFPIIRKAWETGNLESLTKNSPARATNAHISIVGHIVKDEVRRYLSRTEAGNGFGNRFLWVCAKRSKYLPEGGQTDKLNFSPLICRLKSAIESTRGIRKLNRDEGAREIWCAVYPQLSQGMPGLLGAVTSRAEAQVMRLACLYALLDGLTEIKATHLRAALAVWEYCDASAKFIFGDALGDPIADEILTALRNNFHGLTRTGISDLFGRNRGKDQIGRALGTLLEAGLVQMEQEETNGRNAERWYAR